MSEHQFFYRISRGMRITVRPLFLDDRSNPGDHEFVFAYFVRIENVGDEEAQLLRRRWLIHDSIGEDLEVEGEGVVGEQPLLEPGGVHEYSSFCVLKSPQGYMEGHYLFGRPDGSTFTADIPRFILDSAGSADSLG
ncbi:MAG: Co2+/Mg2+ efflux protein ApaG [Gemmatimonadales bacterium]